MQNAAGFVESNENYKVEAEAEEKKPEPSALEKFWKAVRDNPSDFTGWTYLLQYVEQQVRLKILKDRNGFRRNKSL